ncbi:hypothetical protein Hanom_Chr16g01490411 [Helianthus anomalus]
MMMMKKKKMKMKKKRRLFVQDVKKHSLAKAIHVPRKIVTFIFTNHATTWKKEIHHKSHPEHPLTLLPQAPYDNKDGTGFTYHCSICTFDLHTTCVSLPETVNPDDHKHTLKLFYSCPVKDEDFYCDVCHGEVQKDCYGSHLDCVDCEKYECTLDPQAQLQMLQLQMQMARQSAQFMASCGASLASLA